MSACPLVVLACESLHVCTVCIWRCEHARFCVEGFYALYINFHSFIHSYTTKHTHTYWTWIHVYNFFFCSMCEAGIVFFVLHRLSTLRDYSILPDPMKRSPRKSSRLQPISTQVPTPFFTSCRSTATCPKNKTPFCIWRIFFIPTSSSSPSSSSRGETSWKRKRWHWKHCWNRPTNRSKKCWESAKTECWSSTTRVAARGISRSTCFWRWSGR